MRRVWILGVGLLLASGCATSSVVANAPNPSSAAVSGMADSSASSAVSAPPNPSSPVVSGLVGGSASPAVSEPPTPREPQVSPTLATVSGTTAALPGAPKKCTSAQLAVTLGTREQAMNQPAIAVIFTNTGTIPCALYGYPGVAGLDAHGRQIAQAYRTTQVYMGGAGIPTQVTLASGGQASALIGGGAQPVNGQTACPADYAAVLVTPPGATTPTKLPVEFPSCSGLAVTPVVLGPTGGFTSPLSSP
jgi:hypothetical protein